MGRPVAKGAGGMGRPMVQPTHDDGCGTGPWGGLSYTARTIDHGTSPGDQAGRYRVLWEGEAAGQ